MSPEVTRPPNEEIEIKPSSTVTIRGYSVRSKAGEIKINPDATGPGVILRFELWHNPHAPTTFSGVTGVRIPFGDTLLQIVKRTDNMAQWNIGDTVLGTYADRSSQDWRPDITTTRWTTVNNCCYYTRAADPLDPEASWTSVSQTMFISFNLQTKRP